jgi:hypothetical protein
MKSFAFIAVLLILLNTATKASEREYLIYDSAGEYALAWGCSNLKVDYVRLDTDENYRSNVFAICDVNNYMINLYEDRIVQTNTSDGYYPTRNTNQNHYSMSFSSLSSWIFNVANTNYATVDFYTINYSYKWESTQNIVAAVLPYNEGKATQSEVYTCTTCSDEALKAMLVKTGWNSSRTDSFAWNISFEREVNPKTSIEYLVVKAYGAVPKQNTSAQLKADIDVTFDYATKTFSLSVAKLLQSKYEQ